MGLKVDLINLPPIVAPIPQKTLITHSLGYFIIISSSRSGHNFVRENIMSWTNLRELVSRRYLNFENQHPKDFNERTEGIKLNEYPSSILVIQTRDLLNWCASIIKFINTSDYKLDWRFDMKLKAWIEINKEYYNETNYLPDNFIRVLYDEFFRSREYRQNICRQIPDARYDEKELNKVTLNGGGSSFDKQSYDGRASEMQVLERYKQVPEDLQHWWGVLGDYPEAIELYLKYYDVSDDKKRFIDNIK